MEKHEGVASLVPQVFFDIIARLIPGAFFIGVFAIVIFGTDEYWEFFVDWLSPLGGENKRFPSITLFLALGFVASYVISVFIWGIWYGFNCALCIVTNMSMRVDGETGIVFSGAKQLHRYRQSYSLIKKYMPEAGSRITKLKAEIHMSATMSAGLVIAILLNTVLNYFAYTTSRTYVSIFLLVAFIGSLMAGKHFKVHMKRSIHIVAVHCQKMVSAAGVSGAGS